MALLKEMFSRKRILPLLFIIVLLVIWYLRKPTPLMILEGHTFGKISYTIKYKDAKKRNFKPSIDSLLYSFNNAVSHYRPNSELSKFNKGMQIIFTLPYMYPILDMSKHVYETTNGGFNPAIMPLVNRWGFGTDTLTSLPDSLTVDSLRQFTQFSLVQFNTTKAWKLDSRVQLDFSAIAKGKGVDIVMNFMKSKGLKDIFVEIGGEVSAYGTNAYGNPWKIGILNPNSNTTNQYYKAIVYIKNKAVATSANNFNYITRNGVRYVHTLNPFTGYPTNNNILSASVFAENCMMADAYATAFMALGYKKAIKIANEQPEIETFLIYTLLDGSTKTYMTKGLEDILHLQEKNDN